MKNIEDQSNQFKKSLDTVEDKYEYNMNGYKNEIAMLEEKPKLNLKDMERI